MRGTSDFVDANRLKTCAYFSSVTDSTAPKTTPVYGRPKFRTKLTAARSLWPADQSDEVWPANVLKVESPPARAESTKNCEWSRFRNNPSNKDAMEFAAKMPQGRPPCQRDRSRRSTAPSPPATVMAMAHPSGLRASEPIWSTIDKPRFRR